MKRYIKCNTFIKSNYFGVPVTYTDMSPLIMTNEEIASIISELCRIVSNHVDQSFIDTYELYLDADAYHIENRFDRFQACLLSGKVATKETPLGRGRVVTNAPCCIGLQRNLGQFETGDYSIQKFESAIPQFIRFVQSEASKLDAFELDNHPSDAVDSAYTLAHWIVDERLGGCANLDDGFDYLLSRTYENKRSGNYQNENIRDRVETLIDYAEENGWSCKDLIAFSKSCTNYVRRRVK